MNGNEIPLHEIIAVTNGHGGGLLIFFGGHANSETSHDPVSIIHLDWFLGRPEVSFNHRAPACQLVLVSLNW